MKRSQKPEGKYPGKKHQLGGKAGHEGVSSLPGKVFIEDKAMV